MHSHLRGAALCGVDPSQPTPGPWIGTRHVTCHLLYSQSRSSCPRALRRACHCLYCPNAPHMRAQHLSHAQPPQWGCALWWRSKPTPDPRIGTRHVTCHLLHSHSRSSGQRALRPACHCLCCPHAPRMRAQHISHAQPPPWGCALWRRSKPTPGPWIGTRHNTCHLLHSHSRLSSQRALRRACHCLYCPICSTHEGLASLSCTATSVGLRSVVAI